MTLPAGCHRVFNSRVSPAFTSTEMLGPTPRSASLKTSLTAAFPPVSIRSWPSLMVWTAR